MHELHSGAPLRKLTATSGPCEQSSHPLRPHTCTGAPTKVCQAQIRNPNTGYSGLFRDYYRENGNEHGSYYVAVGLYRGYYDSCGLPRTRCWSCTSAHPMKRSERSAPCIIP